MSKKSALLSKVVAMIEKQARNTATGMSFSIYLDDSEPEHYRTRGYHAQSNNNQPIHPQNEDTSHEPNA